MGLKITFVNPNSERDVDKYLPKILAAAVINKIARSQTNSQTEASESNVGHPA